MQCNDLRNTLSEVLDDILTFPEITYVDWLSEPNSGDHFITVASFKYFQDRGIKIKSVHQQEDVEFEGPIISQGGGTMGDLFYKFEKFRCRLIENNHHNPIIIMPQSICFRNPQRLSLSKEAYNAHPDLTLLLREQKSFEIAQEIYPKCKSVLCPDAAWYLTPWVEQMMESMISNTLIRENNRLTVLQNLEGQYWNQQVSKDCNEHIEFVASLAITIGSMLQLSRCDHLVTEKLHGHIMACMMGIPNVILPVGYHKNLSTYKTWTRYLSNTDFGLRMG